MRTQKLAAGRLPNSVPRAMRFTPKSMLLMPDLYLNHLYVYDEKNVRKKGSSIYMYICFPAIRNLMSSLSRILLLDFIYCIGFAR